MNKIETLGNEAMTLAVAMLKNEYNAAQSYVAVARIEKIIKEIGGSPRELFLNAEKVIQTKGETK